MPVSYSHLLLPTVTIDTIYIGCLPLLSDYAHAPYHEKGREGGGDAKHLVKSIAQSIMMPKVTMAGNECLADRGL